MTFTKQQISISNPENRTRTFYIEDVIADLFPFLEQHLPNFPKHLQLTEADEAEDAITQELSSFLNNCERRIYRVEKYHFEFQNQRKRIKSHRSYDIGLLLTASTFSNKLIFIFEAKRLPTGDKKARQYEYISGIKGGGIERFKTGEHETRFAVNGMFDYIQKENTAHWLSFFNIHIETLENHPTDTKVKWSKDELLRHQKNFDKVDYLISRHPLDLDKITLHHYWIDLQ